MPINIHLAGVIKTPPAKYVSLRNIEYVKFRVNEQSVSLDGSNTDSNWFTCYVHEPSLQARVLNEFKQNNFVIVDGTYTDDLLNVGENETVINRCVFVQTINKGNNSDTRRRGKYTTQEIRYANFLNKKFHVSESATDAVDVADLPF